jgi:hypothetical protein
MVIGNIDSKGNKDIAERLIFDYDQVLVSIYESTERPLVYSEIPSGRRKGGKD